MATIYATKADVESELRELYPSGFSGSTDPTDTEVTEKIAEFTTSLRVRVLRAIGAEPTASDDAAALLKRGVVAKVVAWILRKKTVGYTVADIEKLTAPYENVYNDVKKEIEMLPDLFRVPTAVTTNVGSTAVGNRRDPIIADDSIGRLDTF